MQAPCQFSLLAKYFVSVFVLCIFFRFRAILASEFFVKKPPFPVLLQKIWGYILRRISRFDGFSYNILKVSIFFRNFFSQISVSILLMAVTLLSGYLFSA